MCLALGCLSIDEDVRNDNLFYDIVASHHLSISLDETCHKAVFSSILFKNRPRVRKVHPLEPCQVLSVSMEA